MKALSKRVDGFVVLRLPHLCEAELSPKSLPNQGIRYSGIERAPWIDVERSYHDRTLPPALVLARDQIWREAPVHLDLRLCSVLSSAVALLDYSNRDAVQNELIAVQSEKLSALRPSPISADVRWLGVDVYCHGYGSQVRQGVFSHPDLFSEFLDDLNEHGLFDLGSAAIQRYRDAYRSRTAEGNLEPMNAPNQDDLIAVGRIP